MFAVMASNVHWQWMPNGYVAAALGAGAAYILTDVVNELAAVLTRVFEKLRAIRSR